MDEAEFARSIELGRENARIIALAFNHCRKMRFVEAGGRGMLEEIYELPLNARRVECPVAIGRMSGMRLDYVTFDFYESNCVGCQQRDPTGHLPNLESEALERQNYAALEDAKRSVRLRVASVARAGRVERRRSLRAPADPATSSILDDLDILDADPAAEVDTEAAAAARRRLTTAGGRAADRFGDDVVDELFDAVQSVGLFEVLEPLRHLTGRRQGFAERLVATALAALRVVPSQEAGRCLTDHPSLINAAEVDDAVITSIVALAGSKTPDEHHFSGPVPAVQANDPGPLRIIADLCPDKLISRLAEMLPRPSSSALIVGAEHRLPQVSDFDRRSAAGAIERLAITHLDLAIGLLPSLVVSLEVPPQDSYDTGTVAAPQRAIARMFVAAPERARALMDDVGRNASETVRDGLIGSVRFALNMIDTQSAHRHADDPVPTEDESAAVVQAAFTFLLARTDESWGHDVTFSAAEVIEGMGRQDTDMTGHVDAILGAFVTLTRIRDTERETLLTTASPPNPIAPLEAWSRKNGLYQASRRLLNAVETAASAEPVPVCDTIAALIVGERESDLGVDVVSPLLDTLGNIGRRYGDQPGVLQAILPTLNTYLVDADPGPRAAALKAWTAIGGSHDVPSTVADLLPALISDAYLVMVTAVLEAACRLSWPDETSRTRLALHALTVMEEIDVKDHLDTFLMSLWSLRRHVPDLAAVAALERRALARVPDLEWYEVKKVVEQPWQPDARVAPELARLWLSLGPRSTYGLRQRGEAEEVLNGLLECGAGLLGLDATITEIGAKHSPESHFGSLEYAEVLARAERRSDAAALLDSALIRIPDEPARSGQRALVALGVAVARLHETLEPGLAEVPAVRIAVDNVAEAITVCQGQVEEHRRWLEPYARAAAIRAALVCTLFGVVPPADVTRATRDNRDAEWAEPSTNPAEQFKARAQTLRELAAALQGGEKLIRTATHHGVLVTGQLLDAVAHLLDAEAADLNADLNQAAAHRTASGRRAAAVNLSTHRDDDPLLFRARALQDMLVTANDPAAKLDISTVLSAAAALPAPMTYIRALERGHRGRTWTPSPDPEPDSPTVAVALVSIDDTLLTGPAIVDPTLTHTLTLQVQTDPWPDWVERLDAELISTLDETELQRPALTWQRHQHTGDPNTYEGTGSLHVRYAVPTIQHAPPVLVRLTWRGTDSDGEPRSLALDVAGHREFRVRPYDPARDSTTQYEVFDEHLLAIYESLGTAGYPHGQLQAFARLLNAISRAGLAMTWNKKYRRGRYVGERQFHDDLHAELLADPTLEGRVERGTPLAHGYLDTRHDGITAELKVARDHPVTPEAATKYIGQPTQYAAADGSRLSILVILDMSPKVLPIGTPENYLFVLGPKQHGMTDPHSPSVVVTLVINGNLPVPSSWSRRKTPTTNL